MKLLTPVLIIAISVGMYFMYISPTAMDVKVLNQQKIKLDNILEKAKELKIKRESVLLDYTSISESDLDRFNKVIPEKFDPVIFVNNMNTLAFQDSVTVGNFTISSLGSNNEGIVSDVAPVSTYKITSISFKVTGQYDNLLKFLNNLESSLNLFDVVNLSVEQLTSTGSNKNQMQFSLEMNTYSLK